MRNFEEVFDSIRVKVERDQNQLIGRNSTRLLLKARSWTSQESEGSGLENFCGFMPPIPQGFENDRC